MKDQKREKGNITVGTSRAGEVILRVPCPGDIVFTPNQARNVAELLLARADEAEQILRTASN